jgi:hypothetical protein
VPSAKLAAVEITVGLAAVAVKVNGEKPIVASQ